MREVISALSANDYRQHALHDRERNWPETNCYTDLWIEVLNASGLQPEAMLGFTVTQDFEGDQFTFFKVPLEDLESLYGLRVTELAIFDDVEKHTLVQIERGRMALIEVDSYYLPDTREISYRQSHGKTTIAVNGLDPDARRMTYFHNAGFFELGEQDYEGLFRHAQGASPQAALFPYVEFVKFPSRQISPTLADAQALLARRLAQRPQNNPMTAWQKAFPEQLDELLRRPDAYFHIFAFNTLRQIGANFELLASHLEWLQATAMKNEIAAALAIGSAAKTMQFQLARAIARRRSSGLVEMISPMAESYDRLMCGLEKYYGKRRAA